MIDNYLWTELVAFAQYKTLAQTAAKLHVTQPTITRGMKKLEDDLGVQLFKRQPNRISLTKTGELAVQEAQAIVAANEQAVEKIQNFAQSQQVITIGATIPGPLILLKSLQAQLPKQVQLTAQLQQTNIPDLLNRRKFTLLLSDQEIFTDQIESRFLGTERLAVNLNQFMYQANQSAITFKELKGLSFLVLADIGAWNNVINQNIPETKFLYQQQSATFSEITKYSDFPFFSTNLSKFDPQFDQRNNSEDSRIELPITDDAAHMPIYGSYLKSQKPALKVILTEIVQNWPQD
ncbi:LysR family transcriptional regulator [Loigolactobacillus binensis]|uniref:LysR family transcriptional regulator n=1 Tax=Loigolactobacillus binensis TaxID=2559922 RepID=A0ABW3EC49_9LACO|nr:LysR family transcriptional regulator [Loigolactobacillus binensis]